VCKYPQRESTKIQEYTGKIKACSDAPIPDPTQDDSYLQVLQLEQCHNILADDDATIAKEVFYSEQDATMMASYIIEIHEGADNHGASFAQNYILQKGLKKFGDADVAAAGSQFITPVCGY
jgi:hypothetical protein